MTAARKAPLVVAVGVLLIPFAAFGCETFSSGPPPSPPPNIDPMVRLVDLTSAGKATLCDWLATQVGGYRHSIQCEGIATSNLPTTDADQAACVAQFGAFTALECPTTVAEFTSCAEMVVNRCDFATVTSSECLEVSRCYGMPGS